MSTVLTAQARRDAEAAERARAPALEDRSPRPPGEEDEGPDPVVDPVKNPELAKWAQENGMENLLEFTHETLSDLKNHILIESSVHEPSIFLSSAEPMRFVYVPKKLQKACEEKSVFYI